MYPSYKVPIVCLLTMTLLQYCDALDPSKPIYACGKGQTSRTHTSNVHASICKQLRYHEEGHDEPVLINRAFPSFKIMGTELKNKFRQITMADNGELWSIEMQCPFERTGNITCTNPSANVTIWMISFDEKQTRLRNKVIQQFKQEYANNNNYPKNNSIHVTVGTVKERKEMCDQTIPILTAPLIEVILGLPVGVFIGLLISAVVAWHNGTKIQYFLKPFFYHIQRLGRNLQKELSDENMFSQMAGNHQYHKDFLYLECTTLKFVETGKLSEGPMHAAPYRNDILILPGRRRYIDTASCPTKSDRWFYLNALASCFKCMSRCYSDDSSRIPFPKQTIDYPWGLVVVETLKVVYVSGYQNNTVICISLENPNAAITWKVFENKSPATVQLSLSRDAAGKQTLIAASLDVKHLEEYSLEGNFEGKLEFQDPDDFAHIQNAIKKPNRDYVVAHGWKEDKYHRVCLVDPNGRLLGSYGLSKGNGTGKDGQLNTPTHVIVDKHGFVLVADYNNHRILLLSQRLFFVKVLITKEAGLYRPCRIYLDERDETNVRLYVGEDRTVKERVAVFFLKQRPLVSNSDKC